MTGWRKRQVMEMALEALEDQRIFTMRSDHESKELTPVKVTNAITAIKEALAQPEQEPVAWLKVVETPGGWGKFVEAKPNEKGAKPVYTSPPAQRTWVGLSEQDRNDLEDYCEMIIGKTAFDAIEAKLKEKNS